ncbi:MAG: threonine/serine exporter family protein [Clostridia bacterium]|nr:threonine/serine exporter family protein [Clostridia bacterium]
MSETDGAVLNSGSHSADNILRVSLDIGENILRNGGEVHRVEDTITRICRSQGAAHVEVFSITSLIVASVRMDDGTYSQQMRRVYAASNNFTVVESLNQISRALCKGEIDIDEAEKRVLAGKKEKPYSALIIYIASVVAAGCFAVFFGGNLRDGLCAALAGLVVTLMTRKFTSANQMVLTALTSCIAGIIGISLVKIGLGCNADKVMIGTIMLMIPGLALGNSLRDMLCGDVISGALRLIQSLLLAVVIAFGFAVAITIMGGVA